MLRGKERRGETAEGGQERTGKGTEARGDWRTTDRSHQRGCSEGRTRMGGQRGSERGDSGTEKNP